MNHVPEQMTYSVWPLPGTGDARKERLPALRGPGDERASPGSPLVDESAARVVALMVAANGRVDARELQTLEQLDAFRRLKVTRERFIELAQECMDVIRVSSGKRSRLAISRAAHVDALLDDVEDRGSRLFVCRLAAAVIVADGRVTSDERAVYDRALSRWHISQMMVCRAIMADPTP